MASHHAQQAAADFFNRRLKNTRCPFCGIDPPDWVCDDILVVGAVPPQKPGVLFNPSNWGSRGSEFLPVACKACSYTALFSVALMNLTPPAGPSQPQAP